ncbi:MAG: neutral/alkaline non-lysosomal ceramidase N-terminal domain-containing protein [Pseudomonadota bacterium]
MKILNALLACAALLLTARAGIAQVAVPGPLRVGAARVDVTPAEAELPKQYLGILDHVYSRAIVVNNGSATAALVTVDALMINDTVWKRLSARIAAETGIPVKNLVITATGTHSVPFISGAPGAAGVPVSATEQAWAGKIVQSVALAKQKLQPARMSFGTGVAYINVQRDRIDPETHRWWEGPNYEGVSDKSVGVLKFVSLTGEPIAVYYNYGVFNVVTGTLDLVSGDITGASSRYIEDSVGGEFVAALSAGAHGDQNPVYFQQTFDLRELRIKEYAKRGQDISIAMPPSGGTGMDRNNPTVQKLMNQQKQMITSMGQLLGEEVLHAMRNTRREESVVGIYSEQAVARCPGRTRTDQGRGGMAGTYVDDDPVELRLGLTLIGNVAIGSVNAGIYTAIGSRLKKESPLANTMVTTAANGFSNAGYVPDDASYGHEIFSVLNSKLKPGCAESAIVNGILEMMPPLRY